MPTESLAEKKKKLEVRKLAAEAALAELKLKDFKSSMADDAATDEASRYYRYMGAVDKNNVSYAIDELNRMSRRFPGEDITFFICSPGGDVFAGLALYDHLNELRDQGHHITVEAKGFAASMGGIILQAADHRVMSRGCHLLIHEVASLGMGKVSELLDEAQFSKKLWEQLASILAERSTMTAKQIMNKANRKDWWLSASDALELGFVDEVRG